MRNSVIRYLLIFICSCLLSIMLFFIYMTHGRDHLGAISLHGDKHWYRTYDDKFNQQAQDRDIFYHHIGRSIDEAKKADIIILGHSMVLFGLRNDLIEAFEKKYHIKIYNLATAGDGSGEFIRRVIKRWGLHPKLWIINADDHGGSFFSVSLDDFGNFGKSSAPNVVAYSRLNAYLNVWGRNILWRLGDFSHQIYQFLGEPELFLHPISHVFRNIKNGNWDLSQNCYYMNPGLPIKVLRDQNCHATGDEVIESLYYRDDIGGDILLMLIPHSEYCPKRLSELADNLGVESMLFQPKPSYFTIDQSHLNKKGAIAFTKDFLNALEKTQAFKRVINNNTLSKKINLPFNFCFSNKTKARLFVRLMNQISTNDITLNPGESIKKVGERYAVLCWDDQAYSSRNCPHVIAQQRLKC